MHERARARAHTQVQTAVKFVLTEGEKIVLMLFVPLDAHAVGVFAIVSNLGSLVARFLLQPIEEIALSLFSRLGHAGSSADAAQLQQLSVLLRHMMLTVSVLGLVLISFGPNYAFLLFHLLYGAKWSQTDAPAVLSCVMRARAFSQVRRRANARGRGRWYCVYVLLIAVNGVSEAFVHATISPEQNGRLNIVLTALSAAYLALTAVLGAWLGPAGLIAANCLNMAARIGYSAYYARAYFRPLRTFRLLSLVPNGRVLLAFAMCFGATRASLRAIAPAAASTSSKSHAVHVAVGAACLGAVAAVVWCTERTAVRDMRAMWTSRRKTD
jgi:oligosaccharide translocation protein RFT1